MIRPSVLLALVLAAAACADDVPPEGTPTPPPDETPSAMATCTNPQDGFTISYPADWYASPGDVIPECSVFHPEPFQLDPATEIPIHLAIVIGMEPVDFDEVATPNEEFERVIDRRETQLAGRRAVVVEVEATGEGMYEEGTVSYGWLVDLGEETLMAETHDVGDLDFEMKKAVLDEMMQTIRFPTV